MASLPTDDTDRAVRESNSSALSCGDNIDASASDSFDGDDVGRGGAVAIISPVSMTIAF